MRIEALRQHLIDMDDVTMHAVVITVMAKDSSDARLVSRIRGLGFAGLMVEGEHHAAHHLAIARGDLDPHGHR